MKIVFDEKAKRALEEMIKNSNENYIRVKPFIGCGKPAYEIYADFIFTDDGHIVVKGTDYKVALANNSEGTGSTQRRLWSDSGTLKLRDSALFTYTGPKIDEVKTALLGNSSTMYLTGSASASATTGTLKIKSSIYVTTDSAGNAVLAAPAASKSVSFL